MKSRPPRPLRWKSFHPTIFSQVLTAFTLSFLFIQSAWGETPFPEAISIVPADADANTEITLTVDIRKACLPGNNLPLTGTEDLYMSGSAIMAWDHIYDGNHPVYHPDNGQDGTSSILTYNGDSTYSITFTPADFFGLPGDPNIKGISMEFADLNLERSVKSPGYLACGRFYVPLKTNPPVIDTIVPGVRVDIAGLIKDDILLDFDTVYITDFLNVEVGAALGFAPGTCVILNDNGRINVFGRMIAEGNESDTILFTTREPDRARGIWFEMQSETDGSRLKYCSFSNFSTTHDWDGVVNALRYPGLHISHCVFRDNNNHAINLVNADIRVENTLMINNAKGAISSYASHAEFLNCRIMNQPFWHSMYLNLSDPLFMNCIIANNDGGIVLTAADPTFSNCVIARNLGNYLETEISHPRFVNNLIWGNEFGISSVDPTSTLWMLSNIMPDPDPTGEEADRIPFNKYNKFDADPLFNGPSSVMGVDPDALNADWTVPINSPALNAGDLEYNVVEYPGSDLAGNPRIEFGVIDMGPFEYTQAGSNLVISSDITVDEIWAADTVKVMDTISIDPGVKLTIFPGTRVEFYGPHVFNVYGRIIADGTEQFPITFTSGDTSQWSDWSGMEGLWGGFYIENAGQGTSSFQHCIFEYAADIAGNGHGGAIFIRNIEPQSTISHCIFRHNVAMANGGALYVEWGEPVIRDNEFYDNTANQGGAINTYQASSATIRNNYIHHNHSWYLGGGMYCMGAAIVDQNRIGYNSSDGWGGGLYCRKSNARVTRNIIYNNSFGGLAAKNADIFVMSNLIVNNSAEAPVGESFLRRNFAGVYINENSSVTFVNNVIANNKSSAYRAPAMGFESESILMNNIISGNEDAQGNRVQIQYRGAARGLISNCIIDGGESGIVIERADFDGIFDWVIDSLPQFIAPTQGAGNGYDGSQGIWSVLAISPAIDNGYYDQEVYGDIMAAGYDGKAHDPDHLDIGAFEHQTGSLQIGSQPVDIVACDGDSVVFDVVANDTAYFQWYREDQLLVGATDPVLELNPVTTGDAGVYFCRVRNAYGERISEPSFLIVNHPPEIFVQPDDNWMIEGTQVKLEVFAEGSPPMEFAWYKNGTLIPQDPPRPKLLIPSPDSTDEGLYNCTIENMCGLVSTDSIQLYLAPQICMVTVDTATGNNLVIWEKKTNAPVASYNVYRESVVKGQYEVLANVPVNQLSVFADTTANPTEQAYIYKITAMDAEGRESDINLCKPHKTIHLLTSLNTETATAQLDWDEYYGFPYGTYHIYRSIEAAGFNPVKEISSSFTTWLDTDAEPNTLYYYRVSVGRDPVCSPTADGKKATTGPYSHALSNLDDNKLMQSSGGEAPTEITLSQREVTEGLASGTYVGRFTATDADSGDVHTFELVDGAGNDNNADFSISGDSLLTEKVFDYPLDLILSIRVQVTDSSGNSYARSITIEVTVPVGIDRVAYSQALLYPNPASRSATLQFHNPEKAPFTLYMRDLSGKLVRVVREIRTERYHIERGDLSKGYYHLELIGDGKVFRAKMILE